MEMDEEFRTFLESMGYKITVFNEFGNDIYKAISICVTGSPTEYSITSNEIIDYLRSPDGEFAYVTKEDGSRVPNPKVHFIPDACWAFNKLIAAASRIYKINVVVVTCRKQFHQYPDAGGYSRSMTISYERGLGHYHFALLTHQPVEETG